MYTKLYRIENGNRAKGRHLHRGLDGVEQEESVVLLERPRVIFDRCEERRHGAGGAGVEGGASGGRKQDRQEEVRPCHVHERVRLGQARGNSREA